MTYIALLRGINVGKKQVKMDRLKEHFHELGYPDAQTYIQSGNVLFTAPEQDPVALRARLEESLLATFGFAVDVVLLTRGELEAVLAANPYARRALAEGERVYVTFLQQLPATENAARLAPVDGSADELALIGRAVYVLCRGPYHESVYGNAFIEKKLKVAATTRNLQVSEHLLGMCG